MHHVPFADESPPARDPSWAFGGTYMGSEAFGRALLAWPQVRYVFSGHSHRGLCSRRQHLTSINVGSTYATKFYDVIEL